MPLMLIETERTPNPATRKFLPGQIVMESGGRDFATPEAAEASPLANALFATGMVDGVYFGRDFISVSAAPTIEWEDLEPEVLGLLLDHARIERRPEMLDPDVQERRRPERAGPGFEQGISGCRGHLGTRSR